MECSAKTGDKIEEVFQKLGRDMKKQFIDSCEAPKQKEKDGKLKIHAHLIR